VDGGTARLDARFQLLETEHAHGGHFSSVRERGEALGGRKKERKEGTKENPPENRRKGRTP
jgi:hypothetical protein